MEFFWKKYMHIFRSFEPCWRMLFQKDYFKKSHCLPHLTASMTKAKHRNKPDSEAYDCNFRPLYHVLSWRVHYNNLFRHTGKLTHNNCMFYGMIKQTVKLLFYLSTNQKQKKKNTGYILLLCLCCQSKPRVGFRETFQYGKGFCKWVCLKNSGLGLLPVKSFANDRL